MKPVRFVVSAILLMACFSANVNAQFKDQAFTQQYNNDPSHAKDSIDKLFSFKEYFGGLAHKNEIKSGVMFAGSAVFIGGCQIYNKDYWKLPIVYTTTLGALGAGIGLNTTGHHEAAKYCFIGAGVAYWATLMDGIVCYKPNDFPHHGKATIYSILCPGLGQFYNKEYWKIPIYLGGLACSFYFFDMNRVNYERFRTIYHEATEDPSYSGPVTAETAKYYRDVYRRYRDYSVLAFAAVYLLQIIDANVFSYMHDFNVTDDLAMTVSPAVVGVDKQYAFGSTQKPGIGLSFGLRF